MILAAFKINKKKRKWFLIILIIIHIIQITFGLVLLLTGLNIILNLGSKLYLLDKEQVEKVFSSSAAFGFLVTVIYTVGIKIHFNCAEPILHHNPGFALAIWLNVSFITSILGLVLAVLSPRAARNLIQQLKSSMYRGMGQYLNDPSWKRTFDSLQTQMECCGTLRYDDWYRTSWINVDILREDSQTVQHYSEVDGRTLPPVVPWSCCNPNNQEPCFHDILQQQRYARIWKELPQTVVDSLFRQGCLEVMQPEIQIGLLVATFLGIFLFIFQLIITPLARYLYTSSRNSILLGEPKNVAYGWVFGRGDFGYKGAPTMAELELKSEEKKTESHKRIEKKNEANVESGNVSGDETQPLLEPQKKNEKKSHKEKEKLIRTSEKSKKKSSMKKKK